MTEELERYAGIMAEVSGQSVTDILSHRRSWPLPACRWIIAEKMMESHSINSIAKGMGVYHSGLIHGRNVMALWDNPGWEWERRIRKKFIELCR